MATKKDDTPAPPPVVRWYDAAGADAATRQVKFAGVPADRVQDVVAAVQALFPDLKGYRR